MTNEEQKTIALNWLFGDDTGLSSRAICSHMLGLDFSSGSYPSDPSDLGRCLRLLQLIPDWKARINEMSIYGTGWSGLVKKWEQISESMLDEAGINWEKARSAPITYNLMQLAIADGYRSDIRYMCTFSKSGYLQSAHFLKAKK